MMDFDRERAKRTNFAPEDMNAARAFASHFNRRWRYDHVAKRWHGFDGTIWRPDNIKLINRQAFEYVEMALKERADGDKALLKLLNIAPQARALEALATMKDYATDGSDWDQIPYLLGTESGIVDLRKNVLVPATPEMLVTRTTKTEFEPFDPENEGFADRAPTFWKSLMEWTSQDVHQAVFLLLWFGSSLFGTTPEQRFLLMTGTGRNGKGALKNAIIKAVGDYGAQPDANVYMRSRNGPARSDQARADLMALKGRRITFFSEPNGGRFDEELLKAHTGGDTITARALYSNEMVSWEPTHSITFLTNNVPEVDDIGPSMAARVMVADFRENFEGERANTKLGEELAKEASGILSILVWAAKLWFEKGLELPERVRQQSELFIEQSDPVGQFISDECVVGRNEQSSSALLYQAYVDWSREQSREPMSQKRFGSALQRKGMIAYRTETTRGYKGLRPMSAMERADSGDGDD